MHFFDLVYILTPGFWFFFSANKLKAIERMFVHAL